MPLVDTPFGSASVTTTGAGGGVQLRILRATQDNNGAGTDGTNLSNAIAWLFALDASATRVFQQGRPLTILIPTTAQPFLSRINAESGEPPYIRERPASELLLRPLVSAPRTSELFPYQVQGREWLLSRSVGILADDMGLGKTVQVLSAVRFLIGSGAARTGMIVAPRSLMSNWEREIARWTPDLTCITMVPPARLARDAWAAMLGRSHILLTSYEQIRDLAEPLERAMWDFLVFDEAHRLRNAGTALTQSARKLRSHRTWALSGTPVERSAEDLATLLSLLEPSRFSAADKASLHQLRARSRPLILRRTKSQVLDQLPAVTDRLESVELSDAQQSSYDAARRNLLASTDPARVLRLVNELRQICDFDAHSGTSSKLDRAMELLSEIRNLGEEKAVVFSYLLRPLRELSKRLKTASVQHALVTGDMTLAERQASIDSLASGDSDVLLMSSRVGSEGLTLTAANHVIFVNEWWNPSANAQARDRLVRIGQSRPVTVYRLRTTDTIEDILARIHAEKESVYATLVGQANEPRQAGALAQEFKNLLRSRGSLSGRR